MRSAPLVRLTRLLSLGVLVGTIRAPHADAQSSILTFHATAQRTIDAPPAADSLRIVCTREVRADDTPLGANGWLALLAPPGDSAAWMVAFTPKRIGAAREVITTTPRWSPLPTGKPRASGTLDWAWIWDRSGDGRVDYVAYLQNAHALLPDPVPDSLPLPVRAPDGSVRITAPLAYAMIDHTAMIFRHYADEDFDGRADAFVVEEFDDRRPMFVRGWVVARASHHDGMIDEAWAFRHGITDTTRALAREADGTYRTPAVITGKGPPREPAADRLAHATRVLAAIDALAQRCGPAGRIRRP